jgi:hypothetical protein
MSGPNLRMIMTIPIFVTRRSGAPPSQPFRVAKIPGEPCHRMHAGYAMDGHFLHNQIPA